MRRGKWPGGYIHEDADGRPVYVIERRVRRKRFHVSTRAHTLRAAMQQLERFEADPAGYSPEGGMVDALRLTAELVAAYSAYQEARGLSRPYRNDARNRLADWAEDFRGRDLRRLNLRDDVKPALERRARGRAGRIIALKAFFSWLRTERHLLTSAQDCTLDLPVPQGLPEKRRRRKAVDIEHVRAVIPRLGQMHRDILTVLCGTAWHVAELRRFVHRADSEVDYRRRGDTLATLVTVHKLKDEVRTPVKDAEVLAAAERLRTAGVFPGKPSRKIREACLAELDERRRLDPDAVFPIFNLGAMRHTVATWAVEAGATMQEAADFLHHRDKRTTQRFYADAAVPTTPVALPTLRLVGGGG